MAKVFACLLHFVKATDQETGSKCNVRQEFLYWKECEWLHKRPSTAIKNKKPVMYQTCICNIMLCLNSHICLPNFCNRLKYCNINITCNFKQEIVFKKDKATLHVI